MQADYTRGARLVLSGARDKRASRLYQRCTAGSQWWTRQACEQIIPEVHGWFSVVDETTAPCCDSISVFDESVSHLERISAFAQGF